MGLLPRIASGVDSVSCCAYIVWPDGRVLQPPWRLQHLYQRRAAVNPGSVTDLILRIRSGPRRPAQASSSGGTTVVRRIPWAPVTAARTVAADAPGEFATRAVRRSRSRTGQQHSSLANAVGGPPVPRLVISYPGARNSRRPIDWPRFEKFTGRPPRSHAATGITHGCRVITELPSCLDCRLPPRQSHPVAGPDPVPLPGRAGPSSMAPTRAALRFRMRTPASRQSRIASASSSGFALGISSPEAVSAKTGRSQRLAPGQMAGAIEPRFAARIPATKVPCWQAALLAWTHVPQSLPGISRILASAKSGWLIEMGPSMRPIVVSGLPCMRSMSGVSLTKSNGVVMDTREAESRAEK